MRKIKSFKAIAKRVLCVLFFLLSNQFSIAQENIRIMAYNVLQYETSSSTDKKAALSNVIDPINPDILIGVEIKDNTSTADDFRTSVLNSSVPGEYSLGPSPTTIAWGGYSNFAYYKPEKFTFLSGSIITEGGKWPTLEFQLYNNLTGNKIIIYGVHLSSTSSTQRVIEADSIRLSSNALTTGTYFIAAGDFNFVSGASEQAYDSLLVQIPPTGYFLDPESFDASFNTFDIQGTFNKRYDLIMNSQSVVATGGVEYVSFTVDGNNSGTAPGSGTDYVTASDHLPVYADYTFNFPTAKNPPYPGSIVFTQVGADDNDVIEFMTLYRMDLTTLKITDNAVNADSSLGTGEGTFDLSDLSGNSIWKDVPGGIYVRLGTGLSNDNTIGSGDRLLQYNGNLGSAPYPSLDDINGDQLIAYTGSSSSPTYIAGVNWGNNGWLTSGSPNSSTSYAPGTLSDVYLGSSDNYYYSGSVDDILYVTRDSLTISGNWSGADTRFGYKTLTIGNSALPVELIFFAANLNGNRIELRWRTETEVNNYGFDLERMTDEYDWKAIGFVEGHGNSNSPKQYNFIDSEINRSGTYYYRLKQIDNDGAYEYSDVVSVEVGLPNNFYLSQNYPNPFNPETRIDFTLPEKQLVTIRVYNTLGEQVAELFNEERDAGSYSVIFDGSNLPSGVYIYRLQTSSFAANKKMTLLK